MGTSSSNIRDTMAACNANDFTMKYCNESLSRANKQVITAVYETSDDNWLKEQFDKNKIKSFLCDNFANATGLSEFNFKRLSHPRIDTNTKDTCNDKNKTKTREDDQNASVDIIWSSHVLKMLMYVFCIAQFVVIIYMYHGLIILILTMLTEFKLFTYQAHWSQGIIRRQGWWILHIITMLCIQTSAR